MRTKTAEKRGSKGVRGRVGKAAEAGTKMVIGAPQPVSAGEEAQSEAGKHVDGSYDRTIATFNGSISRDNAHREDAKCWIDCLHHGDAYWINPLLRRLALRPQLAGEHEGNLDSDAVKALAMKHAGQVSPKVTFEEFTRVVRLLDDAACDPRTFDTERPTAGELTCFLENNGTDEERAEALLLIAPIADRVYRRIVETKGGERGNTTKS